MLNKKKEFILFLIFCIATKNKCSENNPIVDVDIITFSPYLSNVGLANEKNNISSSTVESTPIRENSNIIKHHNTISKFIKSHLTSIGYKDDIFKSFEIELQQENNIYLYKKDVPINIEKYPEYIYLRYDYKLQCCFPRNLDHFKTNYKKLRKLGIGTFSRVFLICTECCSSKYALKSKKMDSINLISNVGYYDTEIYFAKYFQLNPLPNVAKFYQVYYRDDKLYIALESFTNGTLDGIYFLGDNYNESKLHKYIKGIFIGIASLHKNKIVHGDIKPSNIGIDENDNIKIFDFGLSNKLDSGYDSMNSFIGTPFFMAPEYLHLNRALSYQTDWWAFGVILYRLFEKKYPYSFIPWVYGELEICEKLIKDMQNTKSLKFSNINISPDLKDLIEKLLETDVTKRLGVGENAVSDILNHPYFQGRGYEEILKNIKVI